MKFIAMKFRLVEFGEWGGGITYYIAITLLATCLWDFRPSWTSCNRVWCDDASLGLEASYRKLELLFFWSLRFQTLRISWPCSEHLKTWLVWQLHQESKHRAGSLNCYSVCLWEFKLLKYNCPTSETVSQYFFRPSLVRWCLTRNQCTVLQTVCVAVSSKILHITRGMVWVGLPFSRSWSQGLNSQRRSNMMYIPVVGLLCRCTILEWHVKSAWFHIMSS